VAISPAQLLHSLKEGIKTRCCLRIVRGQVHEHANASLLEALLREHGKRASNRYSTKHGNDATSLHYCRPIRAMTAKTEDMTLLRTFTKYNSFCPFRANYYKLIFFMEIS
jgi:hypothetical protein